MKKWHWVTLVVIALAFTVGASSNYSTEPAPVADGGFKNLKVLPKDITDDQLDSVMSEFSISLGARCGFCHARKADTTKRGLDFASDSKEEKNTARDMYRMTAYINANFYNFNHSTRPDTIHYVICYTCHRGVHEPNAKVFLKQIDSIEETHRRNHPK